CSRTAPRSTPIGPQRRPLDPTLSCIFPIAASAAFLRGRQADRYPAREAANQLGRRPRLVPVKARTVTRPPRPDSQDWAPPGPVEGQMANTVTVGIDASKDYLDVAARPGDRFRVTNDPAGAAELVALLARLGPALVVLEASGGYEAEALAALL